MTTKMKFWPLVVLCLAGLSACKKDDYESLPARRDVMLERQAVAESAMSGVARFAPPKGGSEPAERQLSSRHDLQIQLPGAQLRAAYQSLVDACAGVAEQGCVVMSSSLSGLEEPLSASLHLSIRRAAVKAMRLQAEGIGKVLRQSTEAEDLSGPLVDTGRRLAMKKSLRDSLLELRGRTQGQIEPLLKVTEKLAEVQAEIEADEGRLAGLRARLEMDRVEIGLLSQNEQESRNAIWRSLQNFGKDLSSGLGAMISFVALSLPWLALLLVLPFVWRLARRLWRLGRAQKTQ